ncbi:hypothetical protein [Aeromicrobium sp.]|uniref:hypothetical protein n=1 Tax=Aeromicrobium sp. TaxID=1871063 RepID=UPI00199D15E2|nr:hypothetical protein [Aeromicrobium sp.]MBC7633392.1 hypothetical protein [Aeromicrobium sp.]
MAGSAHVQKTAWVAQGILMELMEISADVAILMMLDDASEFHMTIDDVAEVIVSGLPS